MEEESMDDARIATTEGKRVWVERRREASGKSYTECRGDAIKHQQLDVSRGVNIIKPRHAAEPEHRHNERLDYVKRHKE